MHSSPGTREKLGSHPPLESGFQRHRPSRWNPEVSVWAVRATEAWVGERPWDSARSLALVLEAVGPRGPTGTGRGRLCGGHAHCDSCGRQMRGATQQEVCSGALGPGRGGRGRRGGAAPHPGAWAAAQTQRHRSALWFLPPARLCTPCPCPCLSSCPEVPPLCLQLASRPWPACLSCVSAFRAPFHAESLPPRT